MAEAQCPRLSLFHSLCHLSASTDRMALAEVFKQVAGVDARGLES